MKHSIYMIADMSASLSPIISSLLILLNKGLAIGMVAGTLKSLWHLHSKTFKWLILLTDFILAIIVGSSMWHLMLDAPLGDLEKVIFTFLVSINAFIVLTALTNLKVIFLGGRALILGDKASLIELSRIYGSVEGAEPKPRERDSYSNRNETDYSVPDSDRESWQNVDEEYNYGDTSKTSPKVRPRNR